MLKNKAIILIVGALILATVQAHAQQVIKNQQIMTIAGKVLYVDSAAQTVGVNTKKGQMVFQITAESDLLRFAHHMASIEIQKNDPVIVQYEVVGFGKRIITRLVDQEPDTLNGKASLL